MAYKIIMKPVSNIAFEEDYHRLCQLEVTESMKAIGVSVTDVKIEHYHKGSMMTLNVMPIENAFIKSIISRLSFFHMLLEISDEGAILPVVMVNETMFPDDLSTRLKYNGKTNESITRFMLNMGIAASDYAHEKQLNILDPMCGKGTTLFEAITDGHNGYGIEKSKTFMAEMTTYFSRYLKEGRYVHQMRKGKIVENKKNYGETIEFSIARSREDAKNQNASTLKCVCTDTVMASKVYKKNMMHVIVADLPYGIAHIGSKGKSEKTRSLSTLLEAAADSWREVLYDGGVMVLAWNVFTDKREPLVEIFEKKGFKVISFGDDIQLEHRVSQAINRDILILKK